MPFLFWRATWFGRKLTDEEIGKYLADAEHPRKAQHALAQLADRIVAGDRTVARWYRDVVRLSHHRLPELRMTAAWVMGQDNRVAMFHDELLRLLRDQDPLVQQNAALGLVRFGDGQARAVLLVMLRPYMLKCPEAGTLRFRLKEGDSLNRGTLIARVEREAGTVEEVRSPVPGTFASKVVTDGARVAAGEAIARLSPSAEQVLAALQGLYFVGHEDDLPEIERYARGVPGMAERVRQQAELTAKAIHARQREPR